MQLAPDILNDLLKPFVMYLATGKDEAVCKRIEERVFEKLLYTFQTPATTAASDSGNDVAMANAEGGNDDSDSVEVLPLLNVQYARVADMLFRVASSPDVTFERHRARIYTLRKKFVAAGLEQKQERKAKNKMKKRERERERE